MRGRDVRRTRGASSPDGGGSFRARYEDLTIIGRGGFSTVYRARDTKIGRDVAVKVLFIDPADAAARRRFEHECRVAGLVGTHPNVMTVYDADFTDEGEPYLAMELCPGGSLGVRVRASGPLSVGETLELGAQTADALHWMHECGALHRDVKPENILINAHDVPVLSDFGIASITNATWTDSLRSFTPVHAAPEVVERGEYSAASDVYSLGSTLYELLTGRAPFSTGEGETVMPVLLRILDNKIPSIERSDVPQPLTDLLRTMMAKDPDERPASAQAVAIALRDIGAALHEAPTATKRVSRSGGERVATANDAFSETVPRLSKTMPQGRATTARTAEAAEAVPGAAKTAPHGSPPSPPRDPPVKGSPAPAPGPRVRRRRRVGRFASASVAALVLIGGGVAFLASRPDAYSGPCVAGAPPETASAAPFKDGQLIGYTPASGGPPKVYLIAGGARLGVPREEAKQLHITNYWPASEAEVMSLSPHPTDGTVMRDRFGTTFLIVGGAHLTVHDRDELREIPHRTAKVDPIPVGGLDDAKTIPRDGTLVRQLGSDTVWRIDHGVARPVEHPCDGTYIYTIPSGHDVWADIVTSTTTSRS